MTLAPENERERGGGGEGESECVRREGGREREDVKRDRITNQKDWGMLSDSLFLCFPLSHKLRVLPRQIPSSSD